MDDSARFFSFQRRETESVVIILFDWTQSPFGIFAGPSWRHLKDNRRRLKPRHGQVEGKLGTCHMARCVVTCCYYLLLSGYGSMGFSSGVQRYTAISARWKRAPWQLTACWSNWLGIEKPFSRLEFFRLKECPHSCPRKYYIHWIKGHQQHSTLKSIEHDSVWINMD